jgi:hypothetical protein
LVVAGLMHRAEHSTGASTHLGVPLQDVRF